MFEAGLALLAESDWHRRTGRGVGGSGGRGVGGSGGRGGRGGLQPPQVLGNSDFLGSKRKFGQSQFLKTFPCIFLLV